MHTSTGPDFLSLPARASKPRRSGFTHVLDKGLSLVALESLVETAGDYVDFVKLGWGTAYVAGGVRAKVAVCQDAGINVCLGGTLSEIVASQRKVDEYVRWMHRLGLEYVEVSNGALGMPTERKQALIRELSGEFRVISEVGSKSPAEPVVPSRWVAEMVADVRAGASLVMAEGRESGTVGLFGPTGEVNADLVESVVAAVPVDLLIFEAPRREQQAWFIRRLGADVNLGNIAPDELLSLETLRRGLRADTLDLLPSPDGESPAAAGPGHVHRPSAGRPAAGQR
ncbi:phosphosulfolactate synthase [soil metagenome]